MQNLVSVLLFNYSLIFYQRNSLVKFPGNFLEKKKRTSCFFTPNLLNENYIQFDVKENWGKLSVGK